MGEVVLEVLRDVDLAIEQGEVVCVMGPSGSGKSTLLNIVGGLDRPSAGSVLVDGQDLAGMDDERLAEYRRHQVGFVFQSFNLIPTMSARGNVELPLVFAGVAPAERGARAQAALEAVGLSSRIDHRPTELSGGEQQRVAIARAFVNRPMILIADEPTGNLDPSTSVGIMKLLDRINRTGTTVVMATHDAAIVDSMRRRVVELDDGRVVRDQVRGVYGYGA